MNKNQLKLNPKKTMFIPFSRRRDPTTYSPLRLDDETIMSPVTKVRNLGVVSDSRSSFDSHIRELRKSCFYQLCRLNFVCAYIPSAQFAILIHSFITSRIDFCNSVYFTLPDYSRSRIQTIQNKETLEKVQRAATCTILPDMEYEDRLKFLDSPKLCDFMMKAV